MLDITIIPKPTKMSKVNLDALIPREDFEIMKDSPAAPPLLPATSISELENGKFFLAVLRKPDFQRETSEWTPEKVSEFIFSFLNDDLIPSIILWNSGSRNFVIDGAHRLSALIAWVVDDYGDGVISQAFFNNNIPKGQLDIADKTRKLIKKKFGTYRDHQIAITNPNSSSDILERATRLATLTLQLQWVKGNASKAEDSFFKINEEAAPINDTEKTLLKARSKPNAIAARAIIRSGSGHKYWSKFDADKITEIEELAKEINQILFTPALEVPLKTLDIPLAGKGYSSETLSLIVDMINLSCGIEKKKGTNKDIIFYRKNNNEELELVDDTTGDQTIYLLKKARKILYRISNINGSSLGLHPVVYFYSNTGRYQVTSFLAIIELMKEFESKDGFKSFIPIRKRFEDFLLKYKIFVNQSTVKFGSGLKGYKSLKKLYVAIMDYIKANKTDQEILTLFAESEEYKYLNPNDNDTPLTQRQDFSTESKTTIFLKRALENPITCEICGCMIHKNATTFDHIIRKEDNGTGNPDNGQLGHPYCNTTYKN